MKRGHDTPQGAAYTVQPSIKIKPFFLKLHKFIFLFKNYKSWECKVGRTLLLEAPKVVYTGFNVNHFVSQELWQFLKPLCYATIRTQNDMHCYRFLSAHASPPLL